MNKPRPRDLEYWQHMRNAAADLERACVQMRLFDSVFEDDRAKASTQDTAHAALSIADLLERASRELFTRSCDEHGYAVGDRALTALWGAFDIVTLCVHTLEGGSFGDGRLVTANPVRGAMEAAYAQVIALRRPLDRYLQGVPKPRKAAA